MPYAAQAEIYFIAAMMILILVVSAVSVYIFFKTYKKEMRDKKNRLEQKSRRKAAQENADQ